MLVSASAFLDFGLLCITCMHNQDILIVFLTFSPNPSHILLYSQLEFLFSPHLLEF